MARKQQRRNGGATTYTKSQRSKQKRLQHFNSQAKLAHKVHIEGWNPKLTHQQNYRRLGIAFDSNKVMVSPQLAVLNPEAQLAPSRSGILTERLNYIRSLPPPKPYEVKSMNVQEQYQLQHLIEKHADDYEAMEADLTLNVQQMTANNLQKRIELMFRLQHMTNDGSDDEEESNEEAEAPSKAPRTIISLPDDDRIVEEDRDIIAKLNNALENVSEKIVVPKLSKLPRYKRNKQESKSVPT